MNTRVDRKPEVETKLGKLRQRMVMQGVDAVLLSQTANLAWATAGAATYIIEAADTSPLSILVTTNKAVVLTDAIEAPRLRDEMALTDLGFEIVAEPWYHKGKALADYSAGRRMAADVPGSALNFMGEMQMVRSTLLPQEMDRLREAGKLAAAAMAEAAFQTRPGDTEHRLAARLGAATRARGGTPVVVLVASDERIFTYRHPLPTAKPVEKYAMLVLCFRYEGLVVALTRLVHFGPIPDEVQRKMMACARVDARLILGTLPGRTLGDMWELAKRAYADEGFPEAIEEHHQGGSAGYQPREILATPGDPTPIAVNQAFGWNPSIKGVKSEDGLLLGPGGIEVVSSLPTWPMISVNIDGQTIARPAILQL